jgi:hypothetical protein
MVQGHAANDQMEHSFRFFALFKIHNLSTNIFESLFFHLSLYARLKNGGWTHNNLLVSSLIRSLLRRLKSPQGFCPASF